MAEGGSVEAAGRDAVGPEAYCRGPSPQDHRHRAANCEPRLPGVLERHRSHQRGEEADDCPDAVCLRADGLDHACRLLRRRHSRRISCDFAGVPRSRVYLPHCVLDVVGAPHVGGDRTALRRRPERLAVAKDLCGLQPEFGRLVRAGGAGCAQLGHGPPEHSEGHCEVPRCPPAGAGPAEQSVPLAAEQEPRRVHDHARAARGHERSPFEGPAAAGVPPVEHQVSASQRRGRAGASRIRRAAGKRQRGPQPREGAGCR
mmetsp:Transcript_78289/g.227053  ORF Transcript_78289/g.227053 Transcript_78289/m.227053 type:complete len:258 (-) Transcript_78289:439-1212(-)